MDHILDIENLDDKFISIIETQEFQDLQSAYNDAKYVLFFGHGGNLGVADHAAIDASRLTNKNVIAPGSGILATSIIGDTNFNDWLKTWVEMRTRGIDPKECLVLGMSCSSSGESSNTIRTALEWASEQGIPSFMFTATKKHNLDNSVTQIVQNTVHYHTSEILSLILTYQLIHGAGFKCPTISKKAAERRFETLGIESEIEDGIRTENEETFYNQQVPPGLENEKDQIAVDFDGVIHNFDKGWHDGTCYGEVIPGSLEAVKKLSEKYDVVIYTAKVKPDRPLVNGKTGGELVYEWLDKNGFLPYVKTVTAEKPRAEFYIDDKAVKFVDWNQTIQEIMK
tara:strand:+ start:4821 stop:5837 length:1017 start_codon:yes stop_codon:yes gene_type:complete